MSDSTSAESAPAWTWRITNYSGAADTGKVSSWVRCVVEGGTPLAVRLAPGSSAAGAAPAPDLAATPGSRPEYAAFYCEFGPLKAGLYTLMADDLDLAVPLWLDGRASAAVTFAPTAARPRPAHVLLLGQLMSNADNFFALTRYVARFQAIVTFDPNQALDAEHVLVIGSPELVSQAVEQRLRDAGVRVERVQGKISELLDRAVTAGTPFMA